MKFPSLPALAAVAALTLTLSACGGSAESAGDDGTTTLKVGTIGISSDAAIALAIEKGYFEDEGLDVQTSVVANPSAGIAAAQSGQLDLTYTPSIPLLNALSQSVPLKVVAAADGYTDDALQKEDPREADDTGLYAAAGTGIERARDLAGKSVSVPARKAQLEVTIANAVKADGGDPSTINWMVLDPASALQSLGQGRIDAAGLVAPFTSKAQQEGATFLAAPGLEFFESGAVGLWVAGGQAAAKDPEAMAGFARAIYKANAYANEHIDEAQKTSAKLTKVDLKTIKAGADSYWPDEVRLEDLQRVDTRLAELGYLQKEVALDDALIIDAD